MLPLLGPPRLDLTSKLAASEAPRFAEALRTRLGIRRDTASGMASFVAAMFAAPRQNGLRLPALAECAHPELPCTVKELRYVLGDARWSSVALRRSLVAAAPLAETTALVVETSEITRNGRPAWDLVSLHAVGPGWTVPLGWQRRCLPPPDRDGVVVMHSDVERETIELLLKNFDTDVRAVTPLVTGPVPPLIVLSRALGENAAVRANIGAVLPEYLALVDGTYMDHRLRGHPYDPFNPEDVLADVLVDRRTGRIDPMPRQVLDGRPRRAAEYATAFDRRGATVFSIARPHVPVPSGVPLGRQPEQRVIRLAEIAALVPDAGAAAELRLTEFRHLDDEGWLRAALLLSAFEVYVQDRLPTLGKESA